MIYGNVELYNVHELLSGSILDVLDEEALARSAVLTQARNRGLADGADREGQWLCRIPDALRRRLNPAARVNALEAPGCEMRFNLRGGPASVTLKTTLPPSVVEVYQGSFLVGWQTVGAEPTVLPLALPGNLDELCRLTEAQRLPFDARLTRVILPWRPAVWLVGLEGDCEPPRPGQTPATTCLFYGSSITHGNASIGPMATYARRTAQLLGMDLLNLGFGGGAHLEPELADYIAARQDWHLAVLEMGINLIGFLEVDEFERRVRDFLPRIARAHAGKWIFCIDLFTCRWDLQGDPKVAAFREVVRRAVGELRQPRLVHLPGNRLLTLLEGLTADLVHPSPHGMEEIARNLQRSIERYRSAGTGDKGGGG